MKKTLLYRLFGIGKIPAHESAAIEREGVVLLDEGFKGTATYRNFRTPRRYSSWRRRGFTASIALTGERLLAFQYARPIIDVPLTDERFHQLDFSVGSEGALTIAFDASLFRSFWSGSLEYRFYTPLAPDFFNRLTAEQKRGL